MTLGLEGKGMYAYPLSPLWSRNIRNISVNTRRNWGQTRNKAATKPPPMGQQQTSQEPRGENSEEPRKWIDRSQMSWFFVETEILLAA